MPIAKVRQRLAELAATGAIVTCNLTRFEHGKRIDALVCRMSGWVPPPAPGRKAKAAARSEPADVCRRPVTGLLMPAVRPVSGGPRARMHQRERTTIDHAQRLGSRVGLFWKRASPRRAIWR